MPSRWFVPIPGLDPSRVKLGHTHAAFSRWFDAAEGDRSTRERPGHAANIKPYAISPPTRFHGQPGIEIGVLTETSEKLLEGTAADSPSIRLGNQVRSVGTPRCLLRRSYSDLSSAPVGGSWDLDLVTPATFRSGDRSSPLPSIDTILTGLCTSWNAWNDLGNTVAAPLSGAVWVSDLALTSEPLVVTIRTQLGDPKQIHLSGVTGRMTLRAEEPADRGLVAPLLRLAEYCGIGGMRGRGFGVVKVRERPMGRAEGR